ncbi:hypothetical protein AX17_000762 [Amanita inopinata Kibby_2008]|nr:hypothetical protein AX17_000762 [Amanita inopinata Kibby_2008]
MPDSKGPVIVITGTPGTGKSTHAQLLATESPIPLKHINVGDWVRERGLYEAYDEEWQSYTVDEDKLLDELEPLVADGGIIIDWHTCEVFPERWPDLVVVLTCNHTTLWDRLEKRGYPLKKIQENNEAEIMEVVLDEARTSYPTEIVVDLKSESMEDLESNVNRIAEWISAWRKEHLVQVGTWLEPRNYALYDSSACRRVKCWQFGTYIKQLLIEPVRDIARIQFLGLRALRAQGPTLTSDMATPSTPDGRSYDSTAVRRPIYETSTQFKNWRYSVEQLAEIRHFLNITAVTAIRKTFDADEPGSSTNVSFLTANEELILVKLYTSKIAQLCALFRFPEEVEATAVSYLKRFYLKNTVMDWHPKNVMLTALFLATKTTNNPISVEAYTSHIPKTMPSDVLDLEFLVAQSLGFEFAVWHAHRALWGIWLDIQAFSDETIKLPISVYDTALNHVRASRLTDAEFIYAPSQIALAAFSFGAPEVAQKWMRSKMPLEAPDTTLSMETFPSVFESIKSLILSKGHPPDVESVREVDRRLRICKNPEKVPGTKAFLAKKADEQRQAEEKRTKKVEEAQKSMSEDPFGDELENTAPRPGLVDYDDDED